MTLALKIALGADALLLVAFSAWLTVVIVCEWNGYRRGRACTRRDGKDLAVLAATDAALGLAAWACVFAITRL